MVAFGYFRIETIIVVKLRLAVQIVDFDNLAIKHFFFVVVDGDKIDRFGMFFCKSVVNHVAYA